MQLLIKYLEISAGQAQELLVGVEYVPSGADQCDVRMGHEMVGEESKEMSPVQLEVELLLVVCGVVGCLHHFRFFLLVSLFLW